MHFHLIVLCTLFSTLSTSIVAQTSVESDTTDLSRYEIFEDGEAAVTLAALAEMEDEYKQAVTAGNCDIAIPKIIAFYEAANITSNLIRRGNEPYYDASRDDRDAVARSSVLLNELIAAERAFNNLLEQRNIAWVEEAKCLIEQGNIQGGVNRLYRALDYISPSERGLWEEARTLLWQQVGLEP